VILFDEIEKAHPEVLNILLQVLDDGRLTDAKGRLVNFKNSIIILTSNLGSSFVDKMESIGFTNNTTSDEYTQTKDKVMGALKDFFRPEFINRLDEIIIFDILSPEVIRNIVDIKIKIIKERLLGKGIILQVNDEALSYLAKEGYDPHYGARPLARIIQDKILNPVAMLIISKGAKKGDTVYASMKGSEISIETKKEINKKKITTVSAKKLPVIIRQSNKVR
jgi:ATP-dependent Clp protease ATP-binding subunit ClpC